MRTGVTSRFQDAAAQPRDRPVGRSSFAARPFPAPSTATAERPAAEPCPDLLYAAYLRQRRVASPSGRSSDVAGGASTGARPIQRKLQPQALSELVSTADPALDQGGKISPPKLIAKTYAKHDQVAGDLESRWMKLCLDNSLDGGVGMGGLDPRVRQALAATPSFNSKLGELAGRVWMPRIATVYHTGLLAGLLPEDPSGTQIEEAQQVMGELPAPRWQTDSFASLGEVENAARSDPDLENAYGSYSSYVDLVRIRGMHPLFHPPFKLALAKMPTAAARRARFKKASSGFSVASKPPEMQSFLSKHPIEGQQLYQQHLVERQKSETKFQKDDIVFVPVDAQADPQGEVLVRYQQRSTSYVLFADLAIDKAPKTGKLDPSDSVPLFPSGKASPDHVGQQALGDCYFLAALAAIARSRPAVVKDVVKDQGKDRYAVRFFKKKTVKDAPPSFSPEWVAVDSAVYVDNTGKPLYAKGSTALWPGVVEKAYAVWSGKGSYERISGGFSNDAFEQVLGEPAEKTDVSKLKTVEGPLGSRKYSMTAVQLFKKIRHVLGSGGLVALDTKMWGSGGTGQSGGENVTEVPGLASSHAYSVFATRGNPEKDEDLYVTIRNPWGHFGRGYQEKKTGIIGFRTRSLAPSAKQAGTFDLELSDLMRYADNLHFV